jgi:hypothetical protein
MSIRKLLPTFAIVASLCLGQGAPSTAAKKEAGRAPAAKSSTWNPPRLPDGKPDLSGYWSNNTATPLERPAALASKEFLSDEEAKRVEIESRDRTRASDRQKTDRPNEVGDYNAIFKEDGRWALPNKRTSIITDPKDGRMPPLTAAAKQKFDADQQYHKLHPHDGPEDMTTIERCITWITSGPPMLPTFYNNNYQLIQTHDSVLIVAEMIHDTRIIPLDGRPHENIPQWMGDSRGHWEGDTLVVETINFNGRRGWFGTPMTEGGGGKRPDQKMKVTERFTRTAPDILLYQFTVDDPGIFTQPWSGEIPMRAVSGPIYEYACHEGNYGMPLILTGARADEQKGK